ncbi:hypothetical protein EIP86_002311 [Pleurotus ostreatoroseus]|nr:hypothetical protein EIP86_002311 [Pleurotus ostreatoroseus]
MDYFTCEDVPLLDDFHKDVGEVHHIEIIDVHKDLHGHFVVDDFPDTPLLTPAASDDDFSDFIASPVSEEPPTLKAKIAAAEALAETAAAEAGPEILSMEYLQHAAIIVLVQLLIPIPFMLPMGFNFTKRALKVFGVGFAVGLVGHVLMNVLQTLPSVRLSDPSTLLLLTEKIPSLDTVLPAFLAQFKMTAIGGFAVGAVMAYVLNFFILGHTICRLARGLEPEPSAMRRAMDASKTFQTIQRFTLDLVTGVSMMPMGLVVRSWWFRLLGLTAAQSVIPYWHAALLGVTGTLAVQLLRMRVRGDTARADTQDAARQTEAIQMSTFTRH